MILEYLPTSEEVTIVIIIIFVESSPLNSNLFYSSS
jgi:hypothetical protein